MTKFLLFVILLGDFIGVATCIAVIGSVLVVLA